MQEGRGAVLVGHLGLGRALALPLLITDGLAPVEEWPEWASDGPLFFSVLSAFPNSFCFSTALQPPGPLMDPLTKGSSGSQMAQTLLWKAKSSLSFGIQPLQTWPTKDPEVEAQVNL